MPRCLLFFSRFGPLGVLVGLAVAALVFGCDRGVAPESRGGPVAMRRLTQSQYRQAIADVFGPEIEIAGRFEPDSRRDGLVAVGSAFVTITPSGFEQYEAMAGSIARQVVSEAHRARLVPCRPSNDSGPDAECSRGLPASHRAAAAPPAARADGSFCADRARRPGRRAARRLLRGPRAGRDEPARRSRLPVSRRVDRARDASR